MIDHIELTVTVRDVDYESDEEVEMLKDAIESHVHTITGAEAEVTVVRVEERHE